jgi:hypothetical protein
MKKREKELATLSRRGQIGFAAACAERALREGSRFTRGDLTEDEQLRPALVLAWRHAGGEDLDYAKDVQTLHHAIARAIPDLDEPDADEVLMEVMFAVSRTLVILEQPERSASAARSAADCTLALMSLVYEDHKGAEANERAWQDQALQLVKAAGDGPITPELFDAIPDWERGPIYKVFRSRFRERS